GPASRSEHYRCGSRREGRRLHSCARRAKSATRLTERQTGGTAMALSHILVGAYATTSAAEPRVRRIGPADLIDALAKGYDDFCAMPSHAVFLCVIYP